MSNMFMININDLVYINYFFVGKYTII